MKVAISFPSKKISFRDFCAVFTLKEEKVLQNDACIGPSLRVLNPTNVHNVVFVLVRTQELQAMRNLEQEKLLALKGKNQQLTMELTTVQARGKVLTQSIVDTRTSVADVKATIDGMRSFLFYLQTIIQFIPLTLELIDAL